MTEKLGCTPWNFRPRYTDHYQRAFQALRSRLPELAEGKRSFAPPF